MEEKELQKSINKYGKMFSGALKRNHVSNYDQIAKQFSIQVREIFQSELYEQYAAYPTIDRNKVFSVIAMCLVLRQNNYADKEIIALVNHAFRVPKKVFYCLEKAVDLLPNAYRIAEKWNCNDHDTRVKDGSVIYDVFEITEGRIEYNISKCMYVEAFKAYGIRELCRIFCITDVDAYARLTRHVNFHRYSDLSDGSCCHDVITRK